MSKSPLFLSMDGLSRLSQQQQEKTPKANWRLSGSLCFVSRDCYWEQVVHYPTSNLSEVRNIISSEIDQVSPHPGKTSAFIINAAKGRTSVLYCCYTNALMKEAEHYKLWRLVPETLPLYRSLPTQNRQHLLDLELTSLYPGDSPGLPEKQRHRLIISTHSNKPASLPVEPVLAPPLSEALVEDAAVINGPQYLSTLAKFRALDYLDFAIQLFGKAKSTLTRNKQLPALACLFLAFTLLTFALGKSAYLLWQHSSLTNQISATKAEASQSIQLLNRLKQSKDDIEKINKHLGNHGPKTQIFNLLDQLVSENKSLSFKMINISPADIRLQGVTDSASALLASLSTIPGFNDVKFSTPPRPLKNVGERFNISITYDHKIYADKPSS